ncbi:ribonuclease HII [Thalassiella azotivora]
MTPPPGPGGAAAPPGPRRGAGAAPSLREERRLLREGHRLVAGMDEVGRGALAGPVTVGVVVVHDGTRTAPSGLRDSKLLTPAARQALAPRLRRWAPAWAVGHAEPEEIDRVGIIAALRLAGRRALAQLPEPPDVVLLDGSHDWLTNPAPDLLDLLGDRPEVGAPDCDPRVRTQVKADLRCAAVAAASVLAKTARDALMVERGLLHPGYRWADNKGYSAPEHLEALGVLGPCEQHRRSWRLPGCAPGAGGDGGMMGEQDRGLAAEGPGPTRAGDRDRSVDRSVVDSDRMGVGS